jgi:hypothetical protein
MTGPARTFDNIDDLIAAAERTFEDSLRQILTKAALQADAPVGDAPPASSLRRGLHWVRIDSDPDAMDRFVADQRAKFDAWKTRTRAEILEMLAAEAKDHE